eukprot:m.156669 g.156669  ORF g.156669 m.156669 type:complete len:124 (+) comp15100_c0_seq3:57-428(+)
MPRIGGRLEIPQELPSPIKYAKGEQPNPVVRWSHQGCRRDKLYMTEDANSHCTDCGHVWGLVESAWSYTNSRGNTEFIQADKQSIASIVGIAACGAMFNNNPDSQAVLEGIMKKVLESLMNDR